MQWVSSSFLGQICHPAQELQSSHHGPWQRPSSFRFLVGWQRPSKIRPTTRHSNSQLHPWLPSSSLHSQHHLHTQNPTFLKNRGKFRLAASPHSPFPSQPPNQSWFTPLQYPLPRHSCKTRNIHFATIHHKTKPIPQPPFFWNYHDTKNLQLLNLFVLINVPTCRFTTFETCFIYHDLLSSGAAFKAQPAHKKFSSTVADWIQFLDTCIQISGLPIDQGWSWCSYHPTLPKILQLFHLCRLNGIYNFPHCKSPKSQLVQKHCILTLPSIRFLPLSSFYLLPHHILDLFYFFIWKHFFP